MSGMHNDAFAYESRTFRDRERRRELGTRNDDT